MIGSFIRLLRAWAIVLAWQLPRVHERLLNSSASSSSTTSRESQQGQRRKRETRRQRRIEKARHRPPPRRLPARGGYQGTKSKDKRYTNHQLLRRMYRKY